MAARSLKSDTRDDSMAELLGPYARCCEEDMAVWLVEPDTPAALADAMRYCVLGGGKRLRPALVLLSAEAAGAAEPGELSRRAAVAVEMVHTYSLVHDDLPAMDDDTLRRGRPTAHVKFGEAMAILAGDALLTRAFGVLAECDDPRASAILSELAHGAGPTGMIAGQVSDMELCDIPPGVEGRRWVHERKTGALIRAAVRMGAISADADDATLFALTRYAEALGLVFQLVDDMLDVTGSAERLGKTPGKDAAVGKRTVVSELGLDGTRRLADQLTQQAAAALKTLGERGGKLVQLSHRLLERTQ